MPVSSRARPTLTGCRRPEEILERVSAFSPWQQLPW